MSTVKIVQESLRLRRGTAAEWASAVTPLGLGEPGYTTDTGILKIGDGVSLWLELEAYTTSGLDPAGFARIGTQGRTDLGLGSIATHAADEFDLAGAADEAQAVAVEAADAARVAALEAVTEETTRALGVEAAKADLVAGVVPSSQLPTFSIEHGAITVANAAARYALVIGSTVATGQPVVQASTSQTFILIEGATDASVSGQWIEIAAIGKVQTVNGHDGAVVLGAADVGAAPASEVERAQAAEQDNAAAILGRLQGTARTGVKSTAYAAVAGDLVPVDATGGALTVTLPSAPPDRSVVAVKLTTAPSAGALVTVACAGADTLNRSTAAPATLMTFALLGQGAFYQYDAASKVWTVFEFGVPLSLLDARFGGGGTSLQKWQPNTAYAAGVQVLSPAGQVISARAAFTSGASYDYRSWNLVTGQALAQALELQPAWVFGHSWQAVDTNATPGARWYQRLMSRLRMGAATNRSVSGRTIGDIANLALSGNNAWVLRTKAFVSAICTINDVTLFAGSDASRRGYNHGWRALLATLTAHASVAANTGAWVYSAGWTTEAITGTAASTQGATTNSTGGTRYKTSTVGAYAQFTFIGPSVDIFLVARALGAGLATISEGATTIGTFDLTATTAQDTPAVFKVRGLTAGNHTITVTLTSGASLTIDSYKIPSLAPVPILIGGEPPVVPKPGDPANYVAIVETLKGDLATICTEYPSVVYVDLTQPDWDTTTMLVNDDGNGGRKHPNDKGCAYVASKMIAAAQAAVGFTTGLNATNVVYPANYVLPSAPAIPTGGTNGLGAGIVDSTAPTVPATPTATAGAGTATATTTGSTDDTGVALYLWFRAGSQVGATTGTSFTETGLPGGAPVTYTVAAQDAAGNTSAQSTASNSVTPTTPTSAVVGGYTVRHRASDDATATGNVVTSWASTGTSTVPFTGTNGPTKRVSSFPYLEFDAVNDALSKAMSARPKTTFLVARVRNSGGASISTGSGSSTETVGVSSGGLFIMNNGAVLGSRPADTSWHVFTVVENGASSIFAVDNQTEETGTAGTNAAAASQYLGRNNSGSAFYGVDIAEIIEYNSVLSASDRASTRSQLLSDYGLV